MATDVKDKVEDRQGEEIEPAHKETRLPQLFKSLPSEIKCEIWEWVVKMDIEKSKRIVPFDALKEAIMPIVNLVSPFLSLTPESRKAAQKYYDFQIDVFHCTRHGKFDTTIGRPAGKLYLNLERDTIMRICNPLATNEWYGLTDYGEHHHKIRTNFPYNVIMKFITATLSDAQYARVKRIYQIWPTPHADEYFDPDCCWDCEMREMREIIRFMRPKYDKDEFSNVWLCRAVILTMMFDHQDLLNDLCELSPHMFWERRRRNFVTCDDPPVRAAVAMGDDEFEPIDEEDGR